jgi:hypothetical protein
MAIAAGSFTQTQTITLKPGQTKQLYRMIMVISFSAINGDGFYEHQDGNCDCLRVK